MAMSPQIDEASASTSWDAQHGIQFDATAGWYWCSLCSFQAASETSWCGEIPLRAIGPHHVDVECHLMSAEHMSAFDANVLAVAEYLPVEINDLPMLLDHHCVFLSSMFGPGKVLYDESIGAMLAVDVCGAVRLFPYHRYRVIQLLIPEAAATDELKERARFDRLRRYHRSGGNAFVWRDQVPRRWRPTSGLGVVPLGPSQRWLYRLRLYIKSEVTFRERRIASRFRRYAALKRNMMLQKASRVSQK